MRENYRYGGLAEKVFSECNLFIYCVLLYCVKGAGCEMELIKTPKVSSSNEINIFL